MTIFRGRSEVMTSDRLRRMVISAMFLSIALVIRTAFPMYIPLFGESGMRIGVHIIFSAIPAILFGPIYGAIVAGLTDFIGFHLRPTGAFIPMLTVTATLVGFVRGALWMVLRDRSPSLMRGCVGVLSVILIGLGGFNTAALHRDGVNGAFYDVFTLELSVNNQGQTVRYIDHDNIDTGGMSAISQMAVTRSINARDPAEVLGEFIMFVTTAVIGSGIFGLLLLLADWVINKFLLKHQMDIQTMPLLLTMMIAAVLLTTLNTFVLQYALPAWRLLPFTVLWLPRVMQTVASTTLITYFIAMLLGVCKGQPHLREWVR